MGSQQGNDHQEGNVAVGKNSNSSVCRQSSTRWTPTTDQIRILKDLYYNNGVRSPTAEQIQRISAKLRQYGNIEGKNVFYWFQNHKARERQKKRLTDIVPQIMHHHCPPLPPPSRPSVYHHHDYHVHHNHLLHHHHHVTPIYGSKFTNIGNFSCASNTGLMRTVGGHGGQGSSSSSSGSSASSSVGMENSFRDCSIAPNGGGSIGQHCNPWTGVEFYSHSSSNSSTYPFLEKRRYTLINGSDQTLDMDEKKEALPPLQVETLPLFPMHGLQDIKQESSTDHHFNGWHHHAETTESSRAASLELTLNSYAVRFPDST